MDRVNVMFLIKFGILISLVIGTGVCSIILDKTPYQKAMEKFRKKEKRDEKASRKNK